MELINALDRNNECDVCFYIKYGANETIEEFFIKMARAIEFCSFNSKTACLPKLNHMVNLLPNRL